MHFLKRRSLKPLFFLRQAGSADTSDNREAEASRAGWLGWGGAGGRDEQGAAVAPWSQGKGLVVLVDTAWGGCS